MTPNLVKRDVFGIAVGGGEEGQVAWHKSGAKLTTISDDISGRFGHASVLIGALAGSWRVVVWGRRLGQRREEMGRERIVLFLYFEG